MPVTGRVLNWKRDPEVLKLPLHKPSFLKALISGLTLPATTDLEPVSPPCYDQLNLGSCTSNAGVGAFEICEHEEKDDFGPSSRLAIYFWARSRQGTASEDSGSTVTNVMLSALQWGLPPETDWPYDVTKFAVNPPHLVYELGAQRRPTNKMVARVQQDHDHVVAMLAAGHAVAIGFDVPQSFMGDDVATTGVWNGPQANDPIIGGHAVCIVGHDDAAKTYKIRNSWGTWGKNGYVTMPQSFVQSSACSDFIAVVDAPK